MDKRIAFLSGIGLGAGAMFLLDPDRGKRRRALIRDKAVHISHTSKESFSALQGNPAGAQSATAH